jgi:hypothetical protein
MSVKDEISKASGAHGLWKARLRSAIESGKVDAAPHQVALDNQCEFGRWLHGSLIDPAAKRSPHYSTCCSLHAAFHKEAASVLRCVAIGQVDKATESLDRGGYADASQKLTKAMMEWSRAA